MLPSKLRRPSKANRRWKTAGQSPCQKNVRGRTVTVAPPYVPVRDFVIHRGDGEADRLTPNQTNTFMYF